MDGINGSSIFTDSSVSKKVATANGSAQVSTAQSKFGGASARLTIGTSDYISIPDSIDFALSGQFTIDCWYKANTRQNYAGIVASQNYNSAVSYTGWNLGCNFIGAGNQPVQFYYYNASTSATIGLAGTNDINDGNWHHLAVTRDGSNVIRLFRDGTQEATTTNAVSMNRGNGLIVGRQWTNNNSGYIDAWVEELQILQGQALYTGSFTPPTAPYDNPATGGGSILHMFV